MFGSTPQRIEEHVVDRVGHAGEDFWYVMLEGDATVYQLRAKHVLDGSHRLVLTKPGDRVRVTIRQSAIVKFENLSMAA